MNLADLETFKCVVDEGGVIRAADKLHRVPSAVTTRIKQLEASMGVELFHRERQRLHLSPAGELLLGYAERLIQLSNEARDVVGGMTPRGILKLVRWRARRQAAFPRSWRIPPSTFRGAAGSDHRHQRLATHATGGAADRRHLRC